MKKAITKLTTAEEIMNLNVDDYNERGIDLMNYEDLFRFVKDNNKSKGIMTCLKYDVTMDTPYLPHLFVTCALQKAMKFNYIKTMTNNFISELFTALELAARNNKDKSLIKFINTINNSAIEKFVHQDLPSEVHSDKQ